MCDTFLSLCILCTYKRTETNFHCTLSIKGGCAPAAACFQSSGVKVTLRAQMSKTWYLPIFPFRISYTPGWIFINLGTNVYHQICAATPIFSLANHIDRIVCIWYDHEVIITDFIL